MESKIQDIIKTLKDKGLLNNILINLNVSSHNDLLFLIDRQIYSYIENLRIFLTRLFEICYDKPLTEFNKLPLEVLLYFTYEKKKELEKCFPILEKNSIYLRLKKVPSEKEYQNILNILSLIGVNIEKIYGFQSKYRSFLDSLKPIQVSSATEKLKKSKRNGIGTKPLVIGGGALILLSFFYFVFDLQSKNKEIQNLKKEVEEKNVKINDLELELQNLKTLLNQKNLEIKNLQNSLELCSEKAKMTTFEIRKFKDQLTKLKHSITWLKSNLRKCREELNKKNLELKQKENKIK